MKTKIVLPIVILLIVAVFVTNGIYGNKIAKEIDLQLKSKIAKNELPVAIIYSEVKVNPLFSKVKIVDISVSDLADKMSFKSKELDIDITYQEALRLAESNDFEEIYSLKLRFVEPTFAVSESDIFVEMQDLTVDFNGHLTKADFENIQSRFPHKKQELEFSFSKLKMNLAEGYLNVPPFSELQKQFTEMDKGSYTLVFLPETNELNIKQFSIESPVISYKGNTTFKYVGNGLNNFKPQTAEMNADLLFHPKDIKWEDRNGGKGEFSLKKLEFKTNSRMNFDSRTFPEGEMKLIVEKLKLDYKDENNSGGSGIFQLPVNNIDVEKLEVNYKMTDEKLRITDTQIKSSLIDASVFADVSMNASNPANSDINKAELKVKNLSPELEEMLHGFEQQMGKDLPREDGVIVLELSGKFGSPKIKGFEF